MEKYVRDGNSVGLPLCTTANSTIPSAAPGSCGITEFTKDRMVPRSDLLGEDAHHGAHDSLG